MTQRIPFERLSQIALARANSFRTTRELYHPASLPTEEERAMEALHFLTLELSKIGDDVFREWVWEQKKRRAKGGKK